MIRLISFVFILILTSCFATSAYNNDVYDLHFNIPDNWTVIEHQNGKVIDLVHNSRTATINIAYYQYEAPVTANGVQVTRSMARYDGWMNMFERPGSVKENNQANVDESYVAVYSKHGLSDDGLLTLEELIVGEYYYVKGNNAAIISLKTEHSFWKVIQGNLRIVVDSFWMGKEKKKLKAARKSPFRKKESWTHSGENGKNQYYFSSPVSWNANLELVFEIPLAKKEKGTHTKPILSDHMVVGVVENQLYGVSLVTGKKTWAYNLNGEVRRNLTAGNDIVSFVLEAEQSTLISVVPETGLLLFKKDIEDLISDPIMVSQNIVLLTEQELRLINGVTGDDIWKVRGRFEEGFVPVWGNDKLIVVKDESTLEARALDTGKKLWEYHSEENIKLQPIISSDLVVFGVSTSNDFDEDQSSLLNAINSETGDLVWETLFSQSTIIDSSWISGTDESIVAVTHYDNNYVVSLLQSKTGILSWRELFTLWTMKRPLVTSSFVMFPNEKNALLNFDVLTGEPLEFSYPHKDKLVHFFMTSYGILGIEAGEEYTLSLYR